jgi:CIC family chloride channel protein
LNTLFDAQALRLWALALGIGAIGAYAAILFLMTISAVQYLAYATADARFYTAIGNLSSWHIVLAPALGGLLIGLLINFLTPGKRAEGVADVIYARALNNARMPLGRGLMSAVISAASLGVGASAGREGPVVHLGATLAAALAKQLRLPALDARVLLGCGVAAAVSASFNAPLAGALFALEVVLGHYALRAFGPIFIASVIGAVISRNHLGDFPAFTIPDYAMLSLWEFPLYGILGIVCAGVALIFMSALIRATETSGRLPLPLWLRPALSGLVLGMIALAFPEVLGVGYGATDTALNGQFSLSLMATLVVVKILATAITFAGCFGGGVFSPSLYLGAMTGGAFGLLAAIFVPGEISSHGLFAILGMGAVAAAVLGAPLSTTLIAFELTGDYQLTLALMVAISVSTAVTQAVLGRSFFEWQLERRGLFRRGMPERRILQGVTVADFMHVLDKSARGSAELLDKDARRLYPGDSLGTALALMESSQADKLPVVDADAPDKPCGYVHASDALRTYNRALVSTYREEHR